MKVLEFFSALSPKREPKLKIGDANQTETSVWMRLRESEDRYAAIKERSFLMRELGGSIERGPR
jgi:hypothetical protein